MPAVKRERSASANVAPPSAKRTNKHQALSIDADGDLILSIGPKASLRLVRVNSDLLKGASPVLKDLIRRNGARESLCVPEDDADAMIAMLWLIHYQTHDVVLEGSNRLQRLAVVCERYDCIQTFDYVFRNVLARSPKNYTTADKFVIAYLIEDQKLFNETADAVIRSSRTYFEAMWTPRAESRIFVDD